MEKNNQCKEDREEEASLILVLRVCAGDVDNMDTTKLTVPPIHGNSHLRGGRGESWQHVTVHESAVSF